MRRKLVETGDVDVMVAIRPNFFYTRAVPCELWFYDRGKPAERRDTVLMLDARQVFRKVTRKIYDFSPEQLADLTAVVWLYRGQGERFEALLARHLGNAVAALQACWQDDAADSACAPLDDFLKAHQALRDLVLPLLQAATVPDGSPHAAVIAEFGAQGQVASAAIEALRSITEPLMGSHSAPGLDFEHSKGFLADRLAVCADAARVLIGTLDQAMRAALRMVDEAEKSPRARDDAPWPTREITRARKALEAARGAAVERLKQVRHFHRHATWLIERFPEARYRDVMGLCKAVTRAEIAAADWSLTPGRYVGVAAVVEDEDFDFEAAFGELRDELKDLNAQAVALAARIEREMVELSR